MAEQHDLEKLDQDLVSIEHFKQQLGEMQHSVHKMEEKWSQEVRCEVEQCVEKYWKDEARRLVNKTMDDRLEGSERDLEIIKSNRKTLLEELRELSAQIKQQRRNIEMSLAEAEASKETLEKWRKEEEALDGKLPQIHQPDSGASQQEIQNLETIKDEVQKQSKTISMELEENRAQLEAIQEKLDALNPLDQKLSSLEERVASISQRQDWIESMENRVTEMQASLGKILLADTEAMESKLQNMLAWKRELEEGNETGFPQLEGELVQPPNSLTLLAQTNWEEFRQTLEDLETRRQSLAMAMEEFSSNLSACEQVSLTLSEAQEDLAPKLQNQKQEWQQLAEKSQRLQSEMQGLSSQAQEIFALSQQVSQTMQEEQKELCKAEKLTEEKLWESQNQVSADNANMDAKLQNAHSLYKWNLWFFVGTVVMLGGNVVVLLLSAIL